MTCSYCGKDGDCRPYGPGGAYICFPCVKVNKELEIIAGMNFIAILEATEAAAHGVSVIDPDGALRPSTQDERNTYLPKTWKYWPESCENCGNDVEVLTSDPRKHWAADGDEVRCVECGYPGFISCDSENAAEIKWHWEIVADMKPPCDCKWCVGEVGR